MPNRYATLAEIRDIAPDLLTASNTTYDVAFIRLSDALSRWVDGYCNRVFYPFNEIRYFDGPQDNRNEIYVDDFVEITAIAYSEDDGDTNTALTTDDYDVLAGDNINPRGTYNNVRLKFNGDLSLWPRGQRAVKITAVWGKTEPREDAFLLTGQAVQDNPLLSTAAALTLLDVDGVDLWGVSPLISAGDILRIEDEYVEVTATNTTANTCTIVRGRNGTTAAAHAQDTPIYKWTIHPKVKQACIIQAVHQFKRGQAGFADAMALPDMGRVMQIKVTDPQVFELLDSLRVWM